MRGIFVLIFVFTCAGFSVSVEQIQRFVSHVSLPSFTLGAFEEKEVAPSIIFGGDVLIGRRIETMMKNDETLNPLSRIRSLLEEHDYMVINLEGSIPPVHVHTPDLTTRFSMERDRVISTLHMAGVDMVSLANNHTYDFGQSAYEHTRTVLAEANIVPVGHPQNDTEYATYVKDFGETKVGFLMLHATEGYNGTTTRDMLFELTRVSDLQVAFVHWGTEYVRAHNREQEKLAHLLIDHGVDAIVGHHPHVMQNIELYDGKPIFYSLGNLVFDQYFNDDVQTGFLVSLTIEQEALQYTLYPYSSLTHPSEPILLEGTLRSKVMDELLNKNFFTDVDRETGSFRIPLYNE